MKKAISLFSSSGIGDLAIKKLGFNLLLSNELIKERSELHKFNFPETEMVTGDIWDKKEEIISKMLKLLDGDCLDFLFATPPCQGMSKNGQGKLLKGIREGGKPKFDPRNRLIIPNSFIKPITHGKDKKRKKLTLRDVIFDTPKLDGKNKALSISGIPYHQVPVLDAKKYDWISNTPANKTAFDNQCINPKCLFQENQTHSDKVVANISPTKALKLRIPRISNKLGTVSFILSIFAFVLERASRINSISMSIDSVFPLKKIPSKLLNI